MKGKGMKRRDFIKGSFALGAAIGLEGCQSIMPKPHARIRGANEDIRIAVIGFGPGQSNNGDGGQGHGHLNTYADKKIPGTRLVAICDVDQSRIDRKVSQLKEKGHPDVKTFTDARKLIEDKEIDAIVIATPHHSHCYLTYMAVANGKDVYCEKPLSHNIWEGRKIIEAAKKYNRVVQVGTQRRADDGWIQVADYLKSGELGKILYSRGFCYKRRDSIGKTTTPTKLPDSINTDLWFGPREPHPLMRERLHYDWHWVWESGNGDLGNQGVHQMDVANWMLNVTELPEGVISVGGRFGYDDDGETANTQIVVLDYKPAPLIFEVRGLPMKAGMRAMDRYKGTSIGNVIECENGYIMEGRVYGKDGQQIHNFPSLEGGNIRENWIDCVRNQTPEKLVCTPAQGHISAACCHLGNISHRIGRDADPDQVKESMKYNAGALEAFERFQEHLAANEIDFKAEKITLGPHLKINPKTERFEGNGDLDEKANAHLKGHYRDGFQIPDAV